MHCFWTRVQSTATASNSVRTLCSALLAPKKMTPKDSRKPGTDTQQHTSEIYLILVPRNPKSRYPSVSKEPCHVQQKQRRQQGHKPNNRKPHWGKCVRVFTEAACSGPVTLSLCTKHTG
eukprot:287911-Pelagomonas_calceolata.AAC.6